MKTSNLRTTFLAKFLTSCNIHAGREAIDFGDSCLTYRQFFELASRVASFVEHQSGDSPYVGLLASRSPMAYAGAIGILLAGKAYVPLNPAFPSSRLQTIIDRAELKTLVLGTEAASIFNSLSGAPNIRNVLVESLQLKDQMDQSHGFRVESLTSCEPKADNFGPLSGDDPAYLLFTSGTTGQPKGISIPHSNVDAYVNWALEALPLQPEDRCSQIFELSFDLSVHDILLTLCQGACLIIPKDGDLLIPSRYISKRRLSTWFSVPSMASQMKQLGLLKPNAYPHLRLVLFCGEALPIPVAEAWHDASPAALILNLYGPTEATIAMALHRYREDEIHSSGTVPLGKAFPHMEAAVFDPDSKKPLPRRESGELWLSGPQLAKGYFHDPVTTTKAFLQLNGKVWYRTGDLAVYDEADTLHFLGRIDQQIKIRGYRIEIGEIEYVLQKASGIDLWVVVLFQNGNDERLVAVHEGLEDIENEACLESCRKELPAYMIPSGVMKLSVFPRNTNGKIDRKAVLNWVKDQIAKTSEN